MGSMTEDSDIKWLMIGFGVMAAFGFIAMAVIGYAESQTDRSAMENGYVQKLEDGKKLWVKVSQ